MNSLATTWKKNGWYRVSDVAHLEHVQKAALALVGVLKAMKLPPKAVAAIAAFEEAIK